MLALLWLCAFSLPAGAAVRVVANANDSGAGSLRFWLTNAAPGDTIVFTNTLTGATIPLTSGELLVSQNLTITGLGATNLAVSGNNTNRVFNILTNVTVSISGLTIKDGNKTGTNGLFNAESVAGGGVLNSGTLLLTNCIITNNSVQGGSSVITFLGGTKGGDGDGGGIFNYGTLALTGCTLSGNVARGGLGGYQENGKAGGNSMGGAIATLGTLALTKCTLTGNTASGGAGGSLVFASTGNGGPGGAGYGGAFHHVGTGSVTLVSCTISGNSSTGGRGGNGPLSLTGYWVGQDYFYYRGGNGGYGRGGGISGPVNPIQNTIVSGNSAGGGVAGGGAVPGFAGVSFGPDVYASVGSIGFNLIGKTNDSSGWVSSDLIGSGGTPRYPVLGPLQNNGGPTPTRLPQYTSAAIDNGISAGLTTDQRGLPRAVDLAGYTSQPGSDGSDIGAVELQAPPVTALDIGLRVFDGTAAIGIACESPAVLPLRISKNGATYGILLVATNSPNASKIRVKTSLGVKAWQKLP